MFIFWKVNRSKELIIGFLGDIGKELYTGCMFWKVNRSKELMIGFLGDIGKELYTGCIPS